MENVFQSTAAALAGGAIRVRYCGPFKYAAIYIDETGGTDDSPLIALGVSDTSLAAAVSAKETVFTSTANTDKIEDIVNSIRWWRTTTSGAEVESGDFECEVLHAIGNSTTDTPYSASTAKFVAEAGTTTNLLATWKETLIWDNDAASVGHVTTRLPHPKTSKGPITIGAVTGDATTATGTVLSSGVTRYIYDNDGNILYSSGKQTALEGAVINWQTLPRSYSGPVIIRDQAYTPSDGDVDGVTTTIVWDVPRIGC